MVKQVIISRPYHDDETAYLHSFMKEILSAGKDLSGIHFMDLEGKLATRKNLMDSVRKGADLICLNGHGTANEVRGHNNEPVLDESNLMITDGTIVYALACDSLIKLGRSSKAKGAHAYIGYSAQFMISHDPARSSSPERDRNALPVKKACNVTVLALLNGETVQTAVDLTRKEYKKLIKTYGNNEDDPYGDAAVIGFALTWNSTFLNFEGDGNARI